MKKQETMETDNYEIEAHQRTFSQEYEKDGSDKETDYAPARTNLVHQVHFSKGFHNTNSVGHHDEPHAIEYRRKRAEFNVSKHEPFFKQMNALKVPYDAHKRAVVRHFCRDVDTQDPFYIVDLSHIVRQYMQWEKFLPRVKPFYAIKCNPSEYMIRTISEMGGSFDCASTSELDLALKYGNVDPATKIVYSNPCKQIDHLLYFKKKGVRLVVVDNEDELRKMHKHWPEAEILIRMRTDDSHSESPFSIKYGASEKQGLTLIQIAKELNLNLVGTSFHVGSSCKDVSVYSKSIKSARFMFDLAEKNGYNFTVLDMGGGFSGHDYDKPSFKDVACSIRDLLDELFPQSVRIIAEPGRYFATACQELVANIISRRTHNQEYKKTFTGLDQPDEEHSLQSKQEKIEQHLVQEADYLYYINSGIYQDFNAIVFDHKVFIVHCLTQDEISKKVKHHSHQREKFKSVIFGPCCDSLDCIAHSIELPKLDLGDWLWFPDMGAYTLASASQFNGFQTKKTYFIWRT